MSSTNKTPNLKLNSWVGIDVPCREDFVRDNNIIDNKVSSHCADNSIHIKDEEREVWNTPIHLQTYFGDGSDYQTVELYCDFEPKWGFVYAAQYPTSRCDVRNNTNYHYFGFFTRGVTEAGLEIKGKQLTVHNTACPFFETEMFSFNQRGFSFNISKSNFKTIS